MSRHLYVTRLLAVVGLGAVIALSAPSRAETFPSKHIQIVVPAAPGGSPDIIARIIAPALATRLGQPVNVDNKAGGAGNIASQQVARAAADGHTLLLANDQLAINQSLFPSLPFDARTSFAPVVHAISSPQVFAVNANVPVRSVQEFLQKAKAEPDKLSLASPAVGTTGQLGVLLLQNQAQIKVKPVVYRSAQPALTDVLGGHADGIIVTVAPALPHIRSGQLRALAVSTGARSAALPDVPTFVEQGLPDFKFSSWQGFVAPAGTPPAVIERLNRELNAVLADPQVRKQLADQAFDIGGGSPAAFARIIDDSVVSWSKVIRDNKIQLD